jgi:hypothetical protein
VHLEARGREHDPALRYQNCATSGAGRDAYL